MRRLPSALPDSNDDTRQPDEILGATVFEQFPAFCGDHGRAEDGPGSRLYIFSSGQVDVL